MTLEDLEEKFQHSNLSQEQVEEKIDEEIEDLLEQKTRSEILEDLEGMHREFREITRDILDYKIMELYADEVRESEEIEDELQEALDEILEEYSREQVMDAAEDLSEDFQERLREMMD